MTFYGVYLGLRSVYVVGLDLCLLDLRFDERFCCLDGEEFMCLACAVARRSWSCTLVFDTWTGSQRFSSIISAGALSDLRIRTSIWFPTACFFFFFCCWLLLGFRTLSGRRFFRTRYAREVWSCKVFSSLGYSMGAAFTNWLMTRLSGSGYPALRARLPGVKHNHIVAINISSQLNLNIDSWTWDQDSMFPLGCIPTIPVLSCQQQRYSRSTDGICRLWMVGTIRRWDCPWIPVLPCWFEDAVHHHGRHCCGLQNLSFIPARSLSETR